MGSIQSNSQYFAEGFQIVAWIHAQGSSLPSDTAQGGDWAVHQELLGMTVSLPGQAPSPVASNNLVMHIIDEGDWVWEYTNEDIDTGDIDDGSTISTGDDQCG